MLFRSCVFVFAATHLVVDVAGWFGTADGGVPVQPIIASRLVDTRNGTGGSNGSFAPGETRILDPGVSGSNRAIVATQPGMRSRETNTPPKISTTT